MPNTESEPLASIRIRPVEGVGGGVGGAAVGLGLGPLMQAEVAIATAARSGASSPRRLIGLIFARWRVRCPRARSAPAGLPAPDSGPRSLGGDRNRAPRIARRTGRGPSRNRARAPQAWA